MSNPDAVSMMKQMCFALRVICGAVLMPWACNSLPSLAVEPGVGTGSAASRSESASHGVTLFGQHDFEKATAVFLKDLQANPDDVQALIYLGRLAFEDESATLRAGQISGAE